MKAFLVQRHKTTIPIWSRVAVFQCLVQMSTVPVDTTVKDRRETHTAPGKTAECPAVLLCVCDSFY